jgi:hypothetical protein
MDPAFYMLLKPNAFALPVFPGITLLYPLFAAPAIIKMINNVFERNKNYYLLLMNINQACFRMLDELVPNRYQVSNNPNLIGWNALMSIHDILNQLMANYGMPKAMVISTMTRCFAARSL